MPTMQAMKQADPMFDLLATAAIEDGIKPENIWVCLEDEWYWLCIEDPSTDPPIMGQVEIPSWATVADQDWGEAAVEGVKGQLAEFRRANGV